MNTTNTRLRPSRMLLSFVVGTFLLLFSCQPETTSGGDGPETLVLSSQIESLQSRLESLQADYTKVQARVSELETTNQQLVKTNEALQKDLQNQDSQSTDSDDQTKLTELQEANQQLASDLEEIRAELAQADSKISELESSATSLNQTIESLRSELSKANAMVSDLENQLANATTNGSTTSGNGVNISTSPISKGKSTDAPTKSTEDVIPIFSDTYEVATDITLSQDNIGQVSTTDAVIKLEDSNELSIDVDNGLDLSEMTHIHINYWVVAAGSLDLVLLSSGVESKYALPVDQKNQWISQEIPLNKFSGINLSNISEIKIIGTDSDVETSGRRPDSSAPSFRHGGQHLAVYFDEIYAFFVEVFGLSETAKQECSNAEDYASISELVKDGLVVDNTELGFGRNYGEFGVPHIGSRGSVPKTSAAYDATVVNLNNYIESFTYNLPASGTKQTYRIPIKMFGLPYFDYIEEVVSAVDNRDTDRFRRLLKNAGISEATIQKHIDGVNQEIEKVELETRKSVNVEDKKEVSERLLLELKKKHSLEVFFYRLGKNSMENVVVDLINKAWTTLAPMGIYSTHMIADSKGVLPKALPFKNKTYLFDDSVGFEGKYPHGFTWNNWLSFGPRYPEDEFVNGKTGSQWSNAFSTEKYFAYYGDAGRIRNLFHLNDIIERVSIYLTFPDYIDIDFDIEKSELILKVSPNNTGEVMISRLYFDTQGDDYWFGDDYGIYKDHYLRTEIILFHCPNNAN